MKKLLFLMIVLISTVSLSKGAWNLHPLFDYSKELLRTRLDNNLPFYIMCTKPGSSGGYYPGGVFNTVFVKGGTADAQTVSWDSICDLCQPPANIGYNFFVALQSPDSDLTNPLGRCFKKLTVFEKE